MDIAAPTISTVLPDREVEAIRRDAESSVGKTFEERTAMFLGLMEVVDAIQSNFPFEERIRRIKIADRIDPRPEPWWHNFREEALSDYQCQTSST